MSEFFKSKRKFGFSLGAVFLAITIALSVFVTSGQGVALMSLDQDLVPDQEEVEVALMELESMDFAPEYEEEPEPEPEPEETVQFRVPGEMRGAYLVPGMDFLKTSDTSQATIQSEVDAAIAAAKKLEINTLIIDTAYSAGEDGGETQVIYQTLDAPELSSGFDVFAYIAGKARDEGFYTYAIFDTSLYQSRQSILSALSVGAGTINKLSTNLTEFTRKYEVDGILLDGYANDSTDGSSYASYLSSGGGIGFENFMRQSPSAVVRSASGTIRDASPGTMVGLLTDAVWENSSANEAGSNTEASYTSLTHGNADTKSFVEKGYVDFVAVKAYTTTDSSTEPFEEVVSWWADVALQNDVPLFVVHATDKLFTSESGWGSADQIIRQIDAVQGVSGVRGSIFNNLQKISTDDGNLATNIKKLYNNEVDAAQILTRLEMTKPAQTTFTTADPQVTFTGASDPGEPVLLDGVAIERDSTGYFTVQKKLEVGENTFTIEHKDRTITYHITRKIELLKSVSPKENNTVEGGMTITFNAMAYEGATVYATIGGATVQMLVDDSVEDESDRDGYFRTYRGTYKAPAATGEVQSLGSVTFHAEAEGETASIQGGSVTVNKKAKVENGVAVRIVADQARTYPADTLDNVPDAGYYPLPAGAMDYAVGDEIFYQKQEGSKTKSYSYFVLASGMRVESKDIAAITDDYPSGNVISGLTVSTGSGYTYVTLNTAQKVTYSVSYTGNSISYEFHNTTSVPESIGLSKNPLFTSANWSGTTLTLGFAKQGAFLGYKGYYDNDGNLVLRFRNPIGSLSGAKIAIDPGHGGGDKGASGFLADYPESVINSQIAQYVADELQSRGATVNLMNNAGIEGEQRKEAAEAWGADLFVSVHANSAPNINATGTEVYYFHPFSQALASNASSAVSSGLSTNNRGAKQSYYYVTLSSQMPSVLVETGFLTNKGEYEKLITAGYQQKIAAGIADALSATISATNTGLNASGTEGTSGAKSTNSTDQSGSGGSGNVAGIYLDSTATVTVGGSTTLKPEFQPADSEEAVTWTSSDTGIATVDAGGKVTGVKEGTAVISVTGTESGESVTCEVTVKATASGSGGAVTGITLSDDTLDISVGQAQTLRATVTPSNADNTRVIWKSSDTAVASVSDGVVTGKQEGIVTITATTDDGGFQASCNVYVVGSGAAANTSLASTDSGVALSRANSIKPYQSSYTVNPGATVRMEIYSHVSELVRGRDFKWSSSNSSVATVDALGNVTGKKTGSARITASASGHSSITWTVDVVSTTIPITRISLDKSSLSLERSRTYQLSASLSPSGSSSTDIIWSSSNAHYASVDANGVVTALAPGTAVITATSRQNGSVKDSCTVTVSNSKTGGGLVSTGDIEGFYVAYGNDNNVSDLRLSTGNTGRLTYEYYPLSATNTAVTWTSYNASIVSIDQRGNFKCLKSGTATIVLSSASNPRINKSIKIVVS